MAKKKRLTMRQLREVLRLKCCGGELSDRQLARRIGVSRSTLQDYVKRLEVAGLSWPLPADMTDEVLERRLFSHNGTKPGWRLRPEPEWPVLVRELKRPGVTLRILWEEYRTVHPTGYGYSRFCDLMGEYELRLSPTMRQHHVAGDKVFVDYSGKKITIHDGVSGAMRTAEIFVAVLGASNYTYAEATWTQSLPDWISSHVRMFTFFGGVSRLIVPDNLKSGVQKASFYDPEINRSYGAMAEYYSVGVLPARPYRPRDKAKVENGVRFAQSYILGRLRNITFFSLEECNRAIGDAVEKINGHVMRRLKMSRRDLFLEVEKPALKALPDLPYEYAEWRRARVNLDYHVELDGFYYSVPHTLLREEVDARMTANVVEIFHRSNRIAVHVRRYGGARHATHPDHMPSSHRHYADWSESRFRHEGAAIGPHTEALIDAVLKSRRHPEQAYRTCLGILKQLRGLARDRAEAACARAVEIGALSSKSLNAILANPDHTASARASQDSPMVHVNIRGSRYYH